MPQLVADIRAGTLQRQYRAADRPDITRVPAPRWDLLDLRHYVTMAVQFSRGCPYDCEFCDIIIMNGRVPRTKTPAQLIAELEGLRSQGWKDMVFIVDDNFIGDKRRTKALAARDDRLARPRPARKWASSPRLQSTSRTTRSFVN